MYNLLGERGFMSAPIRNAADASRVVKKFLKEMAWDVFTLPLAAHQVGQIWIVYIAIGTLRMKFEINAETGEIMKYEPMPSK